MNYFRIPTGSPFCGVCGFTVPGHYSDCPVLTQEPQGPFQWQGQTDYHAVLAKINSVLERIEKRLDQICEADQKNK